MAPLVEALGLQKVGEALDEHRLAGAYRAQEVERANAVLLEELAVGAGELAVRLEDALAKVDGDVLVHVGGKAAGRI
jgi:hypothetical protein